MRTRIHYRLANDPNNQHALWSGAITVDKKPTKNAARKAIAKHLQVEQLPERTLVVTEHELASGNWSAAEIKAETTKIADAPTKKRKKAFADIGMTFDRAEELLKQFGLKN
jgi:hypothetical protein